MRHLEDAVFPLHPFLSFYISLFFYSPALSILQKTSWTRGNSRETRENLARGNAISKISLSLHTFSPFLLPTHSFLLSIPLTLTENMGRLKGTTLNHTSRDSRVNRHRCKWRRACAKFTVFRFEFNTWIRFTGPLMRHPVCKTHGSRMRVGIWETQRCASQQPLLSWMQKRWMHFVAKRERERVVTFPSALFLVISYFPTFPDNWLVSLQENLALRTHFSFVRLLLSSFLPFCVSLLLLSSQSKRE